MRVSYKGITARCQRSEVGSFPTTRSKQLIRGYHKVSDKSVELTRLQNQLADLKTKYPPAVYNKLKLEPEDILAHTREYIRASGKYRFTPQEDLSIRWRLG